MKRKKKAATKGKRATSAKVVSLHDDLAIKSGSRNSLSVYYDFRTIQQVFIAATEAKKAIERVVKSELEKTGENLMDFQISWNNVGITRVKVLAESNKKAVVLSGIMHDDGAWDLDHRKEWTTYQSDELTEYFDNLWIV